MVNCNDPAKEISKVLAEKYVSNLNESISRSTVVINNLKSYWYFKVNRESIMKLLDLENIGGIAIAPGLDDDGNMVLVLAGLKPGNDQDSECKIVFESDSVIMDNLGQGGTYRVVDGQVIFDKFTFM